MITVEEKQALELKINDLKTEIRILEEELLVNERTLWWGKRPHIAEFENQWYRESTDDGGTYSVFDPEGVLLSQQWLSIAGNQALIDRQLAYITEVNGGDYDEDRLHNFLICGLSTDIYCEFSDDPYPDFQNAPDTVRNPNYAS